MEAMRAAAERAMSGHGQIVAAMAEAGTGKSRLLFEFKAKHQSGWMVLETFLGFARQSQRLSSGDRSVARLFQNRAARTMQRTRREKVTGSVLALDRSLEDTLPYLFSLLGIVEGEDPLAQMDAAGPEAAHARSDQADTAARVAQSAADGDLRGPALDRRGRRRSS